MTAGVVFVRVASVFSIVFIGFIANKAGWLPSESSKYLSKIVINIAAPCAVIHSMSSQKFDEGTGLFVAVIIAVSFGAFLLSWLCALPIVSLLRAPKEDRGVYWSFVIFPNNGFMGFPVVTAVFGTQGLFYVILSNMSAIIMQYTLCITLIKRDAAARSHGDLRKESMASRLKSLFDVPLDTALLGLFIFLLKIPVHEGLMDMFSYVGAMMVPLSMIIIGIQLSQSNLREALINPRLIVISVLRLAIVPFLIFILLEFVDMDALVRCVIALSFAMPCAVLPVVFAQEYGANAKLAAEGAFLSTLLSMASLPVACILLSIYVL
ncbi:MAG: AEC family transporter [Clostridiales Family XIII bacterium]|nr:AEC family transporter [Clostridiales Family XIII bacterium]